MGGFDWSIFVNSVFPAYIAAFSTFGLLLVAKNQSSRAVEELKNARIDAQKRAAFDYIKDESRVHENFFKITEKYPNSVVMLQDEVSNTADFQDFAEMLNRRELMADAIVAGILDEKSIRQLLGTRIIEEWKYFRPFVEKFRSTRPDRESYVAFEKFVNYWLADKKEK